MNFTDDVNGTIVGPFNKNYEFWIKEKIGFKIFDTKLDKGGFESDKEAEKWIKNKYPKEYKNGIEMRVFN